MKSQFISKPRMEVSEAFRKGKFRRMVVTQSDLVYYSELLGRRVVVPMHFQSDGASVPQLFWNRYPPFGLYLESAIVHDWYCVLGALNESPVDFKTAAKVFREAMAVQGVGKWKRNMMYQAVRWFGPRFEANQ